MDGVHSRDRYVWLCWNTEHQLLGRVSQNYITLKFAADFPDIRDWVVGVMQRKKGSTPKP